jgi:uncharacterized protein YdeI (YjbR/CyaY-like superfamily)
MARRPPDSIQPETEAELRAWLATHHAREAGIWLVTWKKASGRARLTYEVVVETLLAFGWIDSKANGLDAGRSMLWIAPRKPGTGWSKPNKARVARLLADGRMAPPGLAKVRAAQADGSWTKLDAVEALEIPADLARALAATPAAARHFDAFPRSAKRGILEWIAQAKREETRAKRVAETARLAAINERANQWKGPRGD